MTMTDEPDSVDELISRYLDGEATDDEIARVERDPALVARAESMRAAIEAVAAPVAIPELDLDRIRAAAVAHSATTEQVTDLAAARARKLERRNRIMAAAAAFVFLAVGVVAIQSLGGTDDDDTATDAGDTASSDASSDDAAADDGGDSADFSTMGDDEAEEDDDMAEADMAEEATAESAPADDAADDTDDAAADDGGAADAAEPLPFARLDLLPDELPPVADAAELVALVEEAYAEPVDAEATVGLSPDELRADVCDGAAVLLENLLAAGLAGVEQAAVEIGGLPATVVVGSGLDGSTVILTHAADDCAVVITQAIIEGP